MKCIAIVASVAVLILGVAILAQQKTTSATSILSFTPESPEQELIKLEKQWADAVIKSDLLFLDGIWADDYVWTASDGNFWSKVQTLESLKSGEDRVLSLRTEDVKVRVYGDAAVVTGRSTFNETFKGKDVSGSERFTDTWVKRSGRWQCVAMHCSRIAQK